MKYVNILLLSCLILFAGCISESEDKPKEVLDKKQSREVKTVIKNTDKLLVDMEERRVFATYANDDQQSIRESLILIKSSLADILAGSSPKTSFKTFYTYVKKLQEVKLTLTDASFVSGYKADLMELVQKLKRTLNIDSEDLNWILYETRFSELVPFTNFATAGDWGTDWALGSSYAKVRGYGNRAWLISPTLDLSFTKNAAVRLHHMVMVDNDSRSKIPFDRKKIIENTFKVMVSNDYVSGDPEQANWRELEISNFPATVNFHAVWSNEISLYGNLGSNVSIALLYNMDDKKVGRHYVTWQVNRFQVLGAGENFSITQRPLEVALYEDTFSKKNLGRNKSVATGTDVNWETFGRGGELEFAKIEASLAGINTWLFTPKIELKGEELALKLKEIVRSMEQENFLVKVSTNYNGGDPAEAKWDTLDHVPSDFDAEPGRWTNFNSKEMDLSTYAGKTIVIGFQYINDKGNHTAWEIDELKIVGKGDELRVKELNITYLNDNVIQDVKGVVPVLEYSFAQGLDAFEIKKDETAAEFKVTERNGQTYVEIAGFKAKNNGVSRIISKEVTLGNKTNYIKINQVMNHYTGDAQKKNLLKIVVASEAESFVVAPNKAPLGNSWSAVESEWVELPESLKNQNIKVIFEYKSLAVDGLFPSWNLLDYKIGEK